MSTARMPTAAADHDYAVPFTLALLRVAFEDRHAEPSEPCRLRIVRSPARLFAGRVPALAARPPVDPA